MTRLAFVADVHLGNHRRHGGPAAASLNRRCRQALDVFCRAVEKADELGCDAGFVLGDLLDYQRPEAQLLAEVQGVLRGARARWHLLAGNHEMTSTASGDHALGPLSGDALVVEEPWSGLVGGVEVALLPFRPGVPAAAWLPAELSRWPLADQKGPRVLGVHLGLSDGDTPPWLRGAHDSIDAEALARLAAAHGFSHVFAGNWHDRRSWDFWVNAPAPLRSQASVQVLQLGALVPTGWDNPGVEGYGTLAVWDDGDVAVRWLAGPRFIKAGVGDAQRLAEDARAMGHQPYVQVTAPPESVGAMVATLAEMGLHGEVVTDGADALVAARTAATAARSAETLEDALGGFVREMPLPLSIPSGEDHCATEDAFRAEVLSTSRRYLAAAG